MPVARPSCRRRLRCQRFPRRPQAALGAHGPARGSVAELQLRKQFRFEAAHVLPFHPGKCARMHGHSYRLEVAITGPVQTEGPSRGMVEDFDEIERIVAERIVDRFDHQNLNDFVENPTAENLLLWIWQHLADDLPGLDELVLWETTTACAILRKSMSS
ncbi:MAG TPA: 6-carboxytetrahydropterin synthase QueD [Candidatus Acidoferrum sp.]|nr:6-carboxytetrahydropterin synthase QueD [Candidatus Acidoferrum sp.]